MAVPNGLNPEFYGLVSAGGFRSGGEETAQSCSIAGVAASGTVRKYVFRNPIGFNIKVLAAWAIGTGSSANVVSLVGTDGTLVAITTGGFGTGNESYSTTAITNNMLNAQDTLMVVSSSTTDQTVVFLAYKFNQP